MLIAGSAVLFVAGFVAWYTIWHRRVESSFERVPVRAGRSAPVQREGVRPDDRTRSAMTARRGAGRVVHRCANGASGQRFLCGAYPSPVAWHHAHEVALRSGGDHRRRGRRWLHAPRRLRPPEPVRHGAARRGPRAMPLMCMDVTCGKGARAVRAGTGRRARRCHGRGIAVAAVAATVIRRRRAPVAPCPRAHATRSSTRLSSPSSELRTGASPCPLNGRRRRRDNSQEAPWPPGSSLRTRALRRLGKPGEPHVEVHNRVVAIGAAHPKSQATKPATKRPPGARPPGAPGKKQAAAGHATATAAAKAAAGEVRHGLGVGGRRRGPRSARGIPC